MKIPVDKDLSIQQFFFSDAPLEIGRWKDPGLNMIVTIFRKPGGEWHFCKPGGTADALLKIHYINKKSTLDEAWEILSPLFL